MILRKPYAFFIKYFKLINLIMALLIALFIYNTVKIVSFLNSYVSNPLTIMGTFNLGDIINIYTFIIALVIIIVNIIVMSVMVFKKKPKLLYIYNLVLYAFGLIFFIVCYNALRDVNTTLLDVRFSKALRDISVLVLVLEIVSFVFSLIRATGFDIKKFDFGTDIQALEINEKDSEEIEVAVEFDKNKAKREIRYRLRNIRYTYVEHKFTINLAVIISLIVIAFTVYFNTSIYSANYKENKYFSASGISMKINSSYLVQNDYSGSKLTDNNLIVIRFEVKRNSVQNKRLNTGLINLRANGESYNQITDYSAKLADFGTAYVDQKLTDDYKPYILVFEVPKNVTKAKLKINDNISYVKGQMGAKSIFVSLKLQEIDSKVKTISKNIGDTIDFSDSILENSTLNLKQISMANKFKATYNFCASKNRCYESYEYITPKASGNYIKSLMKVEGNLVLEADVLGVNNLTEFLNMFGTIQYQINGNVKSVKINSEIVKPKIAVDNNFYIEIPREVLTAEKINLIIKVRQMSYIYTIK